MRVVIVGASAAGLTTAETLRSEGFTGKITLVGAENTLPYDRPPLSKAVLLGQREPDALVLRAPERFAELDLDLRLGTRAIDLELDRQQVVLQGAERVDYDRLVIATGAAPRRLAFGDGQEALTLRTAEDALRIRAAARQARQVLIIGAGFLGTEVAASLTASGSSVILVDPAPGPMAIPFGTEISEELAQLHRERGVDLRMGTSIDTIAPHPLGHRFALSDGTEVVSDCVIAAIGAAPVTDWLRTSGLDLSNGVVCDATCQAAPGVYAAGDVAAWRHVASGEVVRIEHRMNATEQAMTVARNLTGAAEAFLPLPYFWTDQYDCKVQSYGLLRGADTRMLLSGDIAERKFVMAYGRAGQVVGVVGCNAARDVIKARRMVADRTPWPELTLRNQ